MKKKPKKSLFAKISGWIVRAALLVLFFTLCQVLALKYINPPFTPNVAWEWAESIIKDAPEKRPVYQWRPINAISPHLRRSVIAAEDQRFLTHHGFDFKEIGNALSGLFKHGRLRGASTISMQTARSVFLLSSRSVLRKAAEVYYTVLIELFWSKRRILEMYLNTVDWGTGVTGAQAASLKYFNKSAKYLTKEEAALMTAILPNPHLWSVRSPTPYLRTRQQQILKTLHMMPLL